MEFKEKIASKIVVNCGFCPHAHMTSGYKNCPDEARDICPWQLEQAGDITDMLFELAKESPTGTFTIESRTINVF